MCTSQLQRWKKCGHFSPAKHYKFCSFAIHFRYRCLTLHPDEEANSPKKMIKHKLIPGRCPDCHFTHQEEIREQISRKKFDRRGRSFFSPWNVGRKEAAVRRGTELRVEV